MDYICINIHFRKPNLINALILFVKNPEKGKVKTRLAATVGDDQALKIYEALIDHTRDLALAVSATRLLFYSEQISTADNWPVDHFQKELQPSGDLGQRMNKAFQTAFEKHQKVVIIGSDCASLSADIIHQAFDQLNHYDFVIGPAMDGGYYLLGMNTFTPSLFSDIPWSTDQVFPKTISKIKILSGTCHLLPTLSDIDYEEDWEKYGWEI